MPKKRTTKPKSVAHLRGYDDQGALVFSEDMPLLDYYEELHDVIDKDEFRAEHGVRRLAGQLYDSDGHLLQEFENEYATDGSCIHSRAHHADGTTTED